MDRNDPHYFRPVYAWAAVASAVVFVVAYAASGRLLTSLLAAAVAGISSALYWYRLLTIGERTRTPRHVDESRLK